MSNILQCTSLGLSIQQQTLLDNVSLDFQTGQFIGLIGPNGAGKSTLLKLLSGLSEPSAGVVRLQGQPLKNYTRRDIAQQVSFVPQDTSINYAFSVKEIVAMGRNPHLGAFQPEAEQDLAIIAEALEKTDLASLADRPVDQLSGGERQRVFIARSLAQQTSVLLMDEPTASLDLCHQLEILSLLRNLAEQGHLVIVAIHDLDMASRFCHRLVIMSKGTIAAEGKPHDVITPQNLRDHFAIEACVEAYPGSSESLRITPLCSTAQK